MARHDLYTPADFNLGFADLEVLHPDQRGEDGEDDAADHEDGAWVSHGVVRAASFRDEDHMMALQGPTRFDAVMRAWERDLRRGIRSRGEPEIRVYRCDDPAYRVGPPLAR